MKKNILSNILYPIVSIAIAILLWSIVALVYDKPLILPSIVDVWQQLCRLLVTANTYVRIGSTALRTIVCFALSGILASLLAICSALSDVFRRLLAPIVTIISAVPIIAITLVVIILLPSQYSPVLVALLVVLPIMYNALLLALDGLSDQLQMCKVYGVPSSSTIGYVYVPTMLPLLVHHSKTTLVLALKVVVSAEVLANTIDSIGSGMYSARVNIATAQLLAWTVICLVICFAIQGIVALCQYLVRRWRACQ